MVFVVTTMRSMYARNVENLRRYSYEDVYEYQSNRQAD